MIQPGIEIQLKNYELKSLVYTDALKILTMQGTKKINTIICIHSIFRRRLIVSSIFGTEVMPKIKGFQTDFIVGQNLNLPSNIYRKLTTMSSTINVGKICEIWLTSMNSKKE